MLMSINKESVKQNALSIEGLTKTYYNKNKNQVTKALNGVSLSVKKGSMLALLGPNGAGKSTFINILAGTVNKTSGKVIINGNNIEKGAQMIQITQQNNFLYLVYNSIFC